MIPRCSISYLPLIANEINQFAADRGMRLNPKKCKELVINFLQYKITPVNEIVLMGKTVERVTSYKLLGVYISSDLTWNVHAENVFKKANKRIYALRLLRKSGVSQVDLVKIYCSLIRSILEYASPVWAALSDYLANLIESIQRKALRIVFPGVEYQDALIQSGLQCLSTRRTNACLKFMNCSTNSEPLKYLVGTKDIVHHGYELRSGHSRSMRTVGNTKRLNDFVTIKYQH